MAAVDIDIDNPLAQKPKSNTNTVKQSQKTNNIFDQFNTQETDKQNSAKAFKLQRNLTETPFLDKLGDGFDFPNFDDNKASKDPFSMFNQENTFTNNTDPFDILSMPSKQHKPQEKCAFDNMLSPDFLNITDHTKTTPFD